MLERTDFEFLPGSQGPRPRIVLLEADDASDVNAFSVPSSQHFVCLVVCTARLTDAAMDRVASVVLESGAVYVCTFGEQCQRLHDFFDETIVGDGSKPDEELCIMTTWHDDEPLDEALWFALFAAHPDPAFEQTCDAIVVLTLGDRRYSEALRRDLADPKAFSQRVETCAGVEPPQAPT